MIRKIFFGFLVAIVSLNIASAVDAAREKLSPELRLLLDLRRAQSEALPAFIQSEASKPEIDVSVRFAPPFSQSDWEGRGVRFRKVEGKPSGAGCIYGAKMRWEEIERWAQDPDILMISSVWKPHVVPCLDVSAPEVGAPAAWQMTTPGGFPIIGTGQLVADFDTGVDIFHPHFFRLTEQRYQWLDEDSNGVLTSGVDVVDLNGNGVGEREEILRLLDGEIYDPALTFGGNGISNADGEYQCDWDWLYNDADDNEQRDYGVSAGFNEASPGFGELIFYCDDVNHNNALDPGEELLLLGQSKVRAVMDAPGSVNRRGTDLIQANPDVNGHGSAVSGILVGGEPGRSRFCGFAPDADLLMGYYFSGVSFDSYLPWVRDEGCRVLLYEFGGFVFNPLDGSSNEEILLDSMAAQGVMQVAPSGNLNRGYKHCQLQIASGEEVPVHFSVNTFQGQTPTWAGITFLWREPSVELSFSLDDPYGYSVDLEGNGSTQTFGSWSVWSDLWVSPRNTVEYDISIWGNSGEPLLGVWLLTIHHPGGVEFEVNGNIADNVTAWEGGAEFEDFRSNDKTVTWPATADSAFVLGSYSTRGYEQYGGVGGGSIQIGGISQFSGRGTRIDGVHILSLAAPGNYDVYTTRSVYGAPFTHGGYRQFSGTSAAGPHVAGSAVLVLQADSTLSRRQVEDQLEQYAYKDGFTGPSYNDTWGHGKIRIADLISYLGVPGSGVKPPLPISLSLTAHPNPFNAAVSLVVELSRRQNVELNAYDVLGRKAAAIHKGVMNAGEQRITWSARGVSSGIYWIVMKTDEGQAARKVVVLK